MTDHTSADTREHLRLLALSLATGSALVEPSVFDAAIDAHRAAVLREAADVAARFNSDCQSCAVELEVATELRRMADETPAAEHRPRRGDEFEAWLKKERDDYASDRANDHTVYDALDDLLDRYRLHADTGTLLGEHVCEGQTVGDCECLEQPAAGAQQDEAQP